MPVSSQPQIETNPDNINAGIKRMQEMTEKAHGPVSERFMRHYYGASKGEVPPKLPVSSQHDTEDGNVGHVSAVDSSSGAASDLVDEFVNTWLGGSETLSDAAELFAEQIRTAEKERWLPIAFALSEWIYQYPNVQLMEDHKAAIILAEAAIRQEEKPSVRPVTGNAEGETVDTGTFLAPPLAGQRQARKDEGE